MVMDLGTCKTPPPQKKNIPVRSKLGPFTLSYLVTLRNGHIWLHSGMVAYLLFWLNGQLPVTEEGNIICTLASNNEGQRWKNKSDDTWP